MNYTMHYNPGNYVSTTDIQNAKIVANLSTSTTVVKTLLKKVGKTLSDLDKGNHVTVESSCRGLLILSKMGSNKIYMLHLADDK